MCSLHTILGWVADHDLDFDDQINVYNARGLLVESQGPVWMYGTAFEHSLLYQYNLHAARNVFMGMIQTETPYFQPASATPFVTSNSTVLSVHDTDPTFCTGDFRCNMAYGLVVQVLYILFMLYTVYYCVFIMSTIHVKYQSSNAIFIDSFVCLFV